MAYESTNAAELPPADYVEWTSRDSWTLLEGAALIAGREPPKHSSGPNDVSSRISDAAARKRFESLYEHLKRRTGIYKTDRTHRLGMQFFDSIVLEGHPPRPGRRQVEPQEVVALAIEKGIDVPEPLLKAFGNSLSSLNASAKNSDSQAQVRYQFVRTIPPREQTVETESSAVGVTLSDVGYSLPKVTLSSVEATEGRPSQNQRPTTNEARDVSTATQAAELAHTNDWKTACRAIADELDARDAEAGAWDSVTHIAERVQNIARERGIRGPHGQLTASNIRREALQGERWSKHRRKVLKK